MNANENNSEISNSHVPQNNIIEEVSFFELIETKPENPEIIIEVDPNTLLEKYLNLQYAFSNSDFSFSPTKEKASSNLSEFILTFPDDHSSKIRKENQLTSTTDRNLHLSLTQFGKENWNGVGTCPAVSPDELSSNLEDLFFDVSLIVLSDKKLQKNISNHINSLEKPVNSIVIGAGSIITSAAAVSILNSYLRDNILEFNEEFTILSKGKNLKSMKLLVKGEDIGNFDHPKKKKENSYLSFGSEVKTLNGNVLSLEIGGSQTNIKKAKSKETFEFNLITPIDRSEISKKSLEFEGEMTTSYLGNRAYEKFLDEKTDLSVSLLLNHQFGVNPKNNLYPLNLNLKITPLRYKSISSTEVGTGNVKNISYSTTMSGNFSYNYLTTNSINYLSLGANTGLSFDLNGQAKPLVGGNVAIKIVPKIKNK